MVPATHSDPSDRVAGSDGTWLRQRTVAVLDWLGDRTAPISLSELAADLAEQTATVCDQLHAGDPATPVHQVRIRLHHVELPILDAAGFLDYDETTRLVSPRIGTEQGAPPLDVTFELLAHRYRRAALDLLEGQGPMGVPELAAEVARWEHRVGVDDLPPDAIDRIHGALYHVHLPKLRQADAVHLNRSHGRVSAGENADWLLTVWRCVDGTRKVATLPPR